MLMPQRRVGGAGQISLIFKRLSLPLFQTHALSRYLLLKNHISISIFNYSKPKNTINYNSWPYFINMKFTTPLLAAFLTSTVISLPLSHMFENGDVAAAYNKEMRMKAAAARAGITLDDGKLNHSSSSSDSNNTNVAGQKALKATIPSSKILVIAAVL
ncbi:unnamed protein product [Ambrosiozyma monospora]|uniref:Unnamed protein product n=1 Tax=Ambrosiozyma monospora TaxID=43982 RepID=A0ACB5SRX7_AMBMO|nr:unnamed protein product [Ambrosiozyma monospora]